MSGTEHGDERPEPWWSRPAYEDRAPGADAGDEQRYDGTQGAFEAPRGAPAYSADADLEPRYDRPVPAGTGWDAREPEGRFLGDAPRRQAAEAWGYPTVAFATTEDGGRRRGRAGAVAAIVALALVGGGIGGATYQSLRGDSSLDPSASLGTGVSNGSIARDPNSIPGIANKVLRSTVSIEVLKSNGTGGSGSGVVLRADGYILTNNHVVEAGANGGAQISVIVNGGEGRSLPATIVGLDPETDLAVIKVNARLEPATLGRSADLAVGDPVIAIGSPLGLNGTVTTGIVSALNRTVNVPGEGARQATPLLNAIQTDAAINPGNSGGALVDRFGAVIGINSAIATLGAGSGGESGSIGVGFAIPVDEARAVAEEIIRTGKATHPAIGVEAGTQVSPDGTKQGARLSRIVAGGPASSASLEVGDVVDRVGTTKVGSVDELILALRESRVGDTVELGYLRDGRQRTTTVVLGDKAGN